LFCAITQSVLLQVFNVEGEHMITRDDLGISNSSGNYEGLAWSGEQGLAIANSISATALLWHGDGV
jgi:hypothetical protein